MDDTPRLMADRAKHPAWTITKPAVTGNGGIVAAQHLEAAQAGADVLAAGGNAMDAAVVCAMVLSVVEPWLSGLGGGGFLLHSTATGEIEALDFNMRAPAGVEISDYPLADGMDGDWFNWPAVEGDRNLIGPLSICVPGAVAGLAEALSRHGTLSWAEALAPATAIAERGMRVDWFAELAFAIDAPGLQRDQAAAALFLDAQRRCPDPTDASASLLPMPGKARMLRTLAARGARDFYEGEIAATLIADLEAAGAKLSARDLADYAPIWRKTASLPYRDRVIHTMSGLSGGPSLLAALDTLAAEDLQDIDEATFAMHHANAIRQAYQTRLTTMGHAAANGDCTSHLSVVDAAGNMVSLTNTLLSRFGSKVVAPRLELLLNNGMMWFDPRPNQPNSIAPGARPLANMSPVIATRDGIPEIAVGAAGGRQIFPAIVQILSRMIDQNVDAGAALHMPRIDASTPTILIDRRAPADTATAISAHHPVQITEDSLYPVQFAIPSLVQRGTNGGPDTGAVHPVSPWTAAVALP